MRTTNQHTSKIVSAAWLFILILSGCGQTELEGLLPDSDDTNTGEPVELRISLADSPEYNNETTSPPATRSGEPLIGEWVKVNSFSATRSAEEYEGPAIAAMELFEDSVSSTPQTRANMAEGCYFRLIAFKKEGTNSYKYQSAADYIAKGASAPVLQRGNIACSMGKTYRFVAYSFNNNTQMGEFPKEYVWNSTSISIPDLTNDFMTFDSGDKVVTGESFALPVSFTHQLCKLTVDIKVTGFDSNNTFSNCKSVYIEQGGKTPTWTVGASAITADGNNSAEFNITGSSATTRLVPNTIARPIKVHFGILTVSDKNADNTTIASSKSVVLQGGKSYTMTVQFKKKAGILVPSDKIDLGGTTCTQNDKKALSALTWADGNLNSKSDNDLTWATNNDRGYYYTWKSTYVMDKNTSYGTGDPCAKLNPSTYGSGWRTPSKAEFESLAKCTDEVLQYPNTAQAGMWFLSLKGLYLPAAGYRNKYDGSGTEALASPGSRGHYWASESNGVNGYYLYFGKGAATVYDGISAYGYSVRCVKGGE